MTTYECPESIEKLEELESLIPMCKKELYLQAKARIESGAVCSIREASRQIGEETGRNPESIRRRISEEQGVRPAHLSEITGTDKYTPNSNILVCKMTGNEEHYTPEEYVNLARLVMGGIDTDPASCEEAQKIVQADVWYSKEDDGLTRDWNGNVFMNPPYSVGVIDKFITKLLEEIELGHTAQAILLTNNNTDTKWFHSAAEKADRICFTKGRINFYQVGDGITTTKTSPTNGQTFFYFGPNGDWFSDLFVDVGLIMVKI